MLHGYYQISPLPVQHLVLGESSRHSYWFVHLKMFYDVLGMFELNVFNSTEHRELFYIFHCLVFIFSC